MFSTREEMVDALVPKGGIYCEIGIFKGEFADKLVSILNPNELHMIDLFTGMCPSGDADGNNVISANLDVEYLKLVEKSKTVPAMRLHKGSSRDVLLEFPDNYFDMIYIDGDHSYAGVKADINIAYTKIKNDGYIMGHDYEMNMAF